MNDDSGGAAATPNGSCRFVLAVLLGLAGSIVIWFAVPYSDGVIFAGFLSSSYLPVPALFMTLLLVLVVNPVLRKLAPRRALNMSELAVVLGIMLVASVLPGAGTLRTIPFAISRVPRDVSQNAQLADAYREAQLRQALFPDKIDGSQPVPVANHFMTELPEGQNIPWAAWLKGPAWSWGLFYLAVWLMMIGLASIVYPQWRDNELLSFPLLTVQQSVIEDAEDGRAYAPLFRHGSFWVAAAAVFALHLLTGMNMYSPEQVPAIPLSWDLLPLFTFEPLNHMPWHIVRGQVFFLLLGVTFFMPSRVSFSIWFTVVAAGMYVMFGLAYVPAFSPQVMGDHRTGAMLTLTVSILWLGRTHWANVFRCMFTAAARGADRRDQRAGWMFAIGCAGIFAWLVFMGNVQPWWAAFYTGIGFMVCLIITRIVAETGMPYIGLAGDTLVKVIGAQLANAKMLWLLSPASLYFSSVIGIVFYTGSQMNVSTMVAHALGLDERADEKHQSRTGVLLLVVLVVGLVICGGAMLAIAYHHGGTADGTVVPLNSWDTRALLLANDDLLRLHEHTKSGKSRIPFNVFSFNDPGRLDLGVGHLTLGALLAGVLYWLCLRSPAWPLHPIGLVMMNTWYANRAWPSLFLGWLIKVLVLRYGGARLFHLARAAFIGLIVGEICAIAFWNVEPAVRVWMGLDYVPTGRR